MITINIVKEISCYINVATHSSVGRATDCRTLACSETSAEISGSLVRIRVSGLHSLLAQLEEHAAVNCGVVGSKPTRGDTVLFRYIT